MYVLSQLLAQSALTLNVQGLGGGVAGCAENRGDIDQMAGQGSTGNVIAAVCSFFVPGLGQLVQGRLGMAVLQFVLAIVLWFFLLGWVIHLWSILDAALWKPAPAQT